MRERIVPLAKKNNNKAGPEKSLVSKPPPPITWKRFRGRLLPFCVPQWFSSLYGFFSKLKRKSQYSAEGVGGICAHPTVVKLYISRLHFLQITTCSAIEHAFALEGSLCSKCTAFSHGLIALLLL